MTCIQTGFTYGDLYGTSAGHRDIIAAKYNGTNGVVIWAIQDGESSPDYSVAIAVDSRGDVYLAGEYGSLYTDNVGSLDKWISKRSGSDGAFMWGLQHGSVDSDSGRGVAVGSGNDVYSVGQTSGSLYDTTFGSSDIWISKISLSPTGQPTGRPTSVSPTTAPTATPTAVPSATPTVHPVAVPGELEWTLSTSVADWPARYYFTSVVHDDRMWVLGGGGVFPYRHDVWSSLDGVSWTEATSPAGWSGRQIHSSVVYDNRMWVMGGYDVDHLHDVWSSSDGETWTPVTSEAGWSARFAHSSVVYNNRMWVMGGNDGSQCNDVWSSSNGVTWTEVKANSEEGWHARSHHTSVVFDGRMWVMGGGGE